MKRISFTMTADNDGKITVKNVLEQIMQNVLQIKAPDTDITKTPLAALTLADDTTKHCVDGYASGLKWENGRFIEYQFTLIFRQQTEQRILKQVENIYLLFYFKKMEVNT